MSSVRFHGYSMYTCSYYRSLFLVCHQLGSMALVCMHVVTIGLCSYYRSLFLVCHQSSMYTCSYCVPSMSSVRFHGSSMYTCSYYRSLFLVCHQLGSMAIVCIHVVTIGLCS